MTDLDKTDQQWRELLSEDEYRICRRQGTERAFSGEYWDTRAEGCYHCRCCDAVLFHSAAKYDSGSGWPSFYQVEEEANVTTVVDKSHDMARVEVRCSNCASHLGHVFEDGPAPTGQRYCINSASLKHKQSGGPEQ